MRFIAISMAIDHAITTSAFTCFINNQEAIQRIIMIITVQV